MSRSTPARRTAALLVGAVVATTATATATATAPATAATATAGTASAGSATPAAATVRAVVAYDGTPVQVAGVQLVRHLPALGMAVVQGSPGALARLGRAYGVRGLAPDDALQLAGGTSGGAGVPAAQGLGGQAGKAGAGAGVRVAVPDTGVSDTAALDRRSGRLLDAFDADGGTAPYSDGYGHGTFMSSILAGGPVDGSAGKPVGVAPGATVLVVRVARPDGTP